MGSPYQKRAADNDKDTTLLVAGLRVDGRDLVLDTLERKLLYSHNLISFFFDLRTHSL